jgi:purine-binding chemotaxis protein CheW
MTDGRGKSSTRRLLICRVGAKLCGLPLEHVRETMRPLPLHELGHMPNFVSGVSVIRGEPTPVLDARRLLGSSADAEPGRYVMLALGQRRAALAVDDVLGVRQVAAETLAGLPAVMSEAENPHVEALGTLDAALLLVLQHAQLVPDELWLRLEQEGREA